MLYSFRFAAAALALSAALAGPALANPFERTLPNGMKLVVARRPGTATVLGTFFGALFIGIINNGLKISLDHEKGGDIAARLDALYDYMVARLLQANIRNDAKALEEVSGLLEEIHSAWREIAPGKTQ